MSGFAHPTKRKAPSIHRFTRPIGGRRLPFVRAAGRLLTLAARAAVAYLHRMSLTVRGYFGVGAEGISKPGNLGALVRTAHAFGASFLFFVNSCWRVREAISDTSKAERSLPLYEVSSAAELVLPRRCKLVGVELTDDAVLLPSFRHPLNAAYVFGPERGSLSPEMTARCDWIVRIPTLFSLNLGIAVGIVLYDRWLCYGRYAERPVRTGCPSEQLAPHVHGRPVFRRPPERSEHAERPELERENEP